MNPRLVLLAFALFLVTPSAARSGFPFSASIGTETLSDRVQLSITLQLDEPITGFVIRRDDATSQCDEPSILIEDFSDQNLAAGSHQFQYADTNPGLGHYVYSIELNGFPGTIIGHSWAHYLSEPLAVGTFESAALGAIQFTPCDNVCFPYVFPFSPAELDPAAFDLIFPLIDTGIPLRIFGDYEFELDIFVFRSITFAQPWTCGSIPVTSESFGAVKARF